MLDKLFFLSLFLNITGLFRFVAAQVNITIGQVSLALLFFNVFYLYSRSGHTRYIIKRQRMLPWLVLLLIWPLATVAYAPSFNLREIGLQVYFFSLFLGTLVWVHRNGLGPVYRLFALGLATTVFGMALSKLVPGFFEAVAILADARVPGETIGGRPTGFYLQPNSLAIALSLLFVGWFGLWQKKTTSKEIFVIIVFLALELATGSRAGIMVGTAIVGVYLLHNWRQRLIRGRLIYWLCIFLAVFLLFIAGARFYLETISQKTASIGSGDLFDRIESIVYFRFSSEESLAKDTSLQFRFMAQKDFLNHIIKRPIHGYGHGAVIHFQETGRLWLSAHSQFLTVAFEYGLFYPCFFLLSIFLFFKSRFRKQIENKLRSNIITQFVFVSAVLFSYAALLELRVFYVLLGLVAALSWYPNRLLRIDTHPG